MRHALRTMYRNDESDTFSAFVEHRHRNKRLHGTPVEEVTLVNVVNEWGTTRIDHLKMLIGREIPAIPLIYSRVVPRTTIRFVGRAFEYTRRNGTIDYGLKIVKLL